MPFLHAEFEHLHGSCPESNMAAADNHRMQSEHLELCQSEIYTEGTETAAAEYRDLDCKSGGPEIRPRIVCSNCCQRLGGPEVVISAAFTHVRARVRVELKHRTGPKRVSPLGFCELL